MTPNATTLEILQENFEERGQILVAIILEMSVLLFASVDRLCLSYIKLDAEIQKKKY